MDNLTHSLFGYAITRIVKDHSSSKSEIKSFFKDPKIKFYLFFISIFAANFPDMDLLYGLYDSSKLGYLTHHRGFTHTFVWIIPQAFLLVAITSLAMKITNKYLIFLGLALAFVNMFFHIGLDSLNVYGVHPFYPFDNHWYYGDTLFIIEPFLWFSFLPLVFDFKKYFKLSIGFFLMFNLVILLTYKIGMLTGLTAFLTMIYFFITSLGIKSLSEKPQSALALLLSLTIISIFSFYHKSTYLEISNEFKKDNLSSESIADLVLSPFPGNPFCWSVNLIRVNSLKEYVVSAGIYRHINSLVCPSPKFREGSELSPVIFERSFSKAFNDKMSWKGEYRIAVSELIQESLNSCSVKNWFQFARIPIKEKDGTYNDLRFSVRSKSSFVSLNPLKDQCSKIQAPWIAPRHAILPKEHFQKKLNRD